MDEILPFEWDFCNERTQGLGVRSEFRDSSDERRATRAARGISHGGSLRDNERPRRDEFGYAKRREGVCREAGARERTQLQCSLPQRRGVR